MRDVVLGSFVGLVLVAALLAACGGGAALPAVSAVELAELQAQLEQQQTQLVALSAAVESLEDRLEALAPSGERVLVIPHTAFATADANMLPVIRSDYVHNWLTGPQLVLRQGIALPTRGRITRVEYKVDRDDFDFDGFSVSLRSYDPDEDRWSTVLSSFPPTGHGVVSASLSTPLTYDPGTQQQITLTISGFGDPLSKLFWAKVYYTADTD